MADRVGADRVGADSPPGGRGTSSRRRGLLDAERLVVFTDAVVAIALTLLVLPLLEAVPEKGTDITTGEWLDDHVSQLLALVVSFAVVASSWSVHNRIWAHVSKQTGRLLALDFAWMFTIVVLQIPTALVYSIPQERALIALYVGTIAAGSVMLTAMAWTIYADPSCQDPDSPMQRQQVVGSAAATAVYLVTFVAAVATGHYWLLFLLALIGVARRVAVRRWGAAER